MEHRPFSQASENNKAPILTILQDVFVQSGIVLEIGSGTGQHALHFSKHLPHLIWQPSDRIENLPGIESWLAEVDYPNLKSVIELDVSISPWPPVGKVNGVFSANTAHIMSWENVEQMFAGVGQLLKTNGYFCLYGPFNYAGQYTSESNATFDQFLQARDNNSGIRDFQALNNLANQHGMFLFADHAMPANNRTLVWEKL